MRACHKIEFGTNSHSLRRHGRFLYNFVPAARAQRHASHGQAPPGQLHGRAGQLGAPAGHGQLRVLLFCGRPARADHRLRGPFKHPAQHAGGGAGLSGRRARPETNHDFCPEPRGAALRVAALPGDDYATGLAGAGAQLQGDAGEPGRQRPEHVRVSGLPGADGIGHSAVPGGVCAGRPGPAGARGADAGGGAAVQ